MTSWPLSLIVWLSVAGAVTSSSSYEVILDRLHQAAMQSASHQSLPSLLKVLQDDGSFSDLSYEAGSSSVYRTHGRRQGALAYHYQLGEDVAMETVKAFTFITSTAPPINDNNWWSHVIGVPTTMWEGVVLARTLLPPNLLNAFLDTFWVNTTEGPVWDVNEHSDKMAGGNFAPRALLGAVEGLVRGKDAFLVRHAQLKEEMHRELALRQPWHGNGLRPDGCLHQHNLKGDYPTENGYLHQTLGMIYNGNYGKEMLKYLTKLFPWFTGTAEDFDEATVEGLFSAYLECNQWLFRGSVMEPTVTGRFITAGNIVTKIGVKDSVQDTGRRLLLLGRHQAEVEAAIDRSQHVTPNCTSALVGHKHFFSSDVTAHQRRKFMATVRVLSNRTSRPETWPTSQNMDGFFQGDGFLSVVADGGEFGEAGREVFQTYDWARVPGVTNLYTPAVPRHHTGPYFAERFLNNAVFVGGVTDGMVGLTTMNYNRPHVPLTALKSWLFLDDVVVVAGSRVTLGQAGMGTGEDVITTLAQVEYEGTHVLGKSGGEETILGVETEVEEQSPAFLHHRGQGYVFLQGDERLHVSATNKLIGTSQQMEVFTAWLSHGTVPQDATLAFAILPTADLQRTREFHQNPEVEVVELTAATHVFCHKPSQTLAVAMQEAGSVSVPSCGNSDSTVLTLKQPSLALLTLGTTDISVSLADPTHTRDTVHFSLTYKGHQIERELPIPADKLGSSVTVTLSI